MTKSSPPQRPAFSHAHLAMRRMCLAAMVGAAVSAALPVATPIAKMPAVPAMLTAIACGVIAALLFMPWRLLHAWTLEQSVVRRLTQRLRRIADGDRDTTVRSLLLDRNDHFGELAQAIHDVASSAASSRLQKQVLHRSMNETIRRETDRAVTVLRQQAESDPLTGLGNRRTLDRLFAKLFDGSGGHMTITALAIDMDRFKAVNDQLGHDIGDECLAFLGNLLRSCLRREDTPIRLGGDEFLVVMPDMSPKAAKPVAERLASLFGQMPWNYDETARPTLSIGLASMAAGDADGGTELLRRADEALYGSKRNGRAMVTLFTDLIQRATVLGIQEREVRRSS